MSPVRRQPVAELDISDALSVTALVPQRIAGSLTDRLAFPLAYCAHYGDDQAAGGGAGVERFRYGNQRHFALLKQFQQTTKVLDAARQSVQLRDDSGGCNFLPIVGASLKPAARWRGRANFELAPHLP